MGEVILSDNYGLDKQSLIFVQQKTTEIRDRIGRAALNVFEIGERLIQVKSRLGHGHFLNWIDAEFKWSESAARKMMCVADRFKSVNFTDLNIAPSALYLLASDSVPDSVVDCIIDEAKAGAAVTHAAVKQAITESRTMNTANIGRSPRLTVEPNIPSAHDEGSTRPEPPAPRRTPLIPKEEHEDIKDYDPDFASAWNALFIELQNVKANKWEAVPKHVAQKYIQLLLNIVNV